MVARRTSVQTYKQVHARTFVRKGGRVCFGTNFLSNVCLDKSGSQLFPQAFSNFRERIISPSFFLTPEIKQFLPSNFNPTSQITSPSIFQLQYYQTPLSYSSSSFSHSSNSSSALLIIYSVIFL